MEQWMARVNFLAEWMPELEMPAIGEEERGVPGRAESVAGARTYREIKDREVWPALREWLSAAQAAGAGGLCAGADQVGERDEHEGAVRGAGKGAGIGAKVQQLYGVTETPDGGSGKGQCLVEVLAPNQRPVQIDRGFEGVLGEQLSGDDEGVEGALSEAPVEVAWRPGPSEPDAGSREGQETGKFGKPERLGAGLGGGLAGGDQPRKCRGRRFRLLPRGNCP